MFSTSRGKTIEYYNLNHFLHNRLTSSLPVSVARQNLIIMNTYLTETSSLDSQTPMTAALVDFAI